jgi:hypothetical protein
MYVRLHYSGHCRHTHIHTCAHWHTHSVCGACKVGKLVPQIKSGASTSAVNTNVPAQLTAVATNDTTSATTMRKTATTTTTMNRGEKTKRSSIGSDLPSSTPPSSAILLPQGQCFIFCMCVCACFIHYTCQNGVCFFFLNPRFEWVLRARTQLYKNLPCFLLGVLAPSNCLACL